MINEYLAHLTAMGKSPDTIKTYKTQLTKFFTWMKETDGTQDPKEIGSADVSEYRNYLQELGKKPATVNTARASLEAFCSWMVAEGHISKNPVSKVRKVEQVQEPPKWLTKSERSKLLRVIEKEKDIRNVAIIHTLLFAGVRASELVKLKHDDILIKERKGTVVIRQGKGNKWRTIPIERDLRSWLGRYMAEVHPTGKWLFPSQRGERLTYIGLYQLCQTIGDKAGIEGLTPHVLRHTYCHDLITRHVDIGTVAVLAGHSKIETTLLYTKPGAEELQKAVDKLSYT
ncbi:MAG: tyrosine-type recombinase/integrase [Desulfitobacteriaceae bacterium]